jgi:hypothetical protein
VGRLRSCKEPSIQREHFGNISGGVGNPFPRGKHFRLKRGYRMGLHKWLTKVEKTSGVLLDEKKQIHYDQSFLYREQQKGLIFTLLLTAALVVIVSKCAALVRAGAGLGIALILNALGNMWIQRLIDKEAGLPEGAIQFRNLNKVLNALLTLIVLSGITLFAVVLWRGGL